MIEIDQDKSKRLDFWFHLHQTEFQKACVAYNNGDREAHTEHTRLAKFYHYRFKAEVDDRYA